MFGNGIRQLHTWHIQYTITKEDDDDSMTHAVPCNFLLKIKLFSFSIKSLPKTIYDVLYKKVRRGLKYYAHIPIDHTGCRIFIYFDYCFFNTFTSYQLFSSTQFDLTIKMFFTSVTQPEYRGV